MIALHYYGSHPEVVKEAWLVAVLNRIKFRTITEASGVWIFELWGYEGVIQLSSFQMKAFLDNLGAESKYVHFYYC